MDHPRLVEYARGQLAKGVSRREIEEYLQQQKWEQSVIDGVLAAAEADAAASPADPSSAATPGPSSPRYLTPILLGLVLALVVWGGYQLYRHFAVAQLVREQTKFVEFRGEISAQLENPPGEPVTTAAPLLNFQGRVDSSNLESPRAVLQVDLDPASAASGSLARLPRDTDARLTALTLMAVAGGGQTLGGAEIRLAEWNTYLRPHRTPLSGNRTAKAVAGFVGALLGPNILADFWLQIPAGSSAPQPAGGLLSTERKATWALLFRPTDKIFGESRELRFLAKEPGGEIDGQPTEIHRYALDGPWLTAQLVGALRELEVDDKLETLAFIQTLVLGEGGEPATASLDTLQISGGELDVWVGRKDTLPHRMAIRLHVREGQRQPLALQLGGQMDINYGEPVTIEAPEQSIDLRQLREQLQMLQGFGGLF